MRLLTLLILLTISCSFDKHVKYFEGELVLQQSYKSDKLNTDSLAATTSNGSYYLINQRYYKGLTYAADSALFILDGKTGKSLYKTKNDKGFSCFDNTMKNIEPGTIKHNGNIETINGFKCKSFEVTSYGRRSIYYYSIDYKINPIVYSMHNKWDWKHLMEQADGGVTVKSIHLGNDYDVIIELKSLKEFRVNDKEFKIKDKEIVSGC
ncbi:MAG: hypothetical protein QM734_07900 [Cyclobacteriaceae bacterium]